MNGILDKKLIEKLTENEKRVYIYLLDNKKLIDSLKIKELAKITYTSSATVIRTAKKLGFKGYKELGFKLKNEAIPLKDCIDDKFYIKNSFEIEKFFKLLDNGKILLYSEGLGENIAKYFYKKLLLLGKNVEYFNSVICGLAQEKICGVKNYDAIILISRKGKEERTLKLASILKELGTKIIVFTSNPHSKLYKISDLGFKFSENIDEIYENYYPNLFYGYTIVFFESLLKKNYEKNNEITKKITE
ncbi:MurR/RpiR family transcriptional regulator [Candidatus Cetobacterium colombiensis]|uniref:MurR/RpiR family transcriptional regulator n=1 Tax=Candidatus Cetobacterium colombiensis TaxID=3073100 RepID=A0ABU4WAK1_9FUSO|nr:MurR/RpiR family transcriptional regulator [Candidatus Cetobacterium colombiensis]MDX8336573.1 MurR/RpiR family transcriptional regulator [Candidatus Cetobacterium colombiensis]